MRCITIVTLLLVWLLPLVGWAQSSVVASGGESSQEGGSFSFSLGLVNFSFLESNDGTVTEGMQHTYEISQIERPKTVVNAIAYPNPATDILFLEIPNSDIANLSYLVLDIKGRELFRAPMVSPISEVYMGSMATGIYFISILKKGKFVTGFKIIKK
ncbi:MAG: T9SS type A sorting domain-containing protein [Flavobacteriaceae bacterium]